MNDIKYEYIDATPAGHITTKKQVWNGEKFVARIQHRLPGRLNEDHRAWLHETFGEKGIRWNQSDSGNFIIMDEQVYAWFQLKWGNK